MAAAAKWYFEEEQDDDDVDVNLEPLIHGPNYFHAGLLRLLLISDFESRGRKYLGILDP